MRIEGRVILADRPDIHDKRSTFWREQFESALDYDTYLSKSDPFKAERWRVLEGLLPPLTDEQKARLTAVDRDMYVLVSSGVWCGDCVRQVPMIRKIADACGANVRLRVIDRDVSQALREELRILGGARVPMVVFLSEDFYEVGRFGDRLLTFYRLKAQRETGAACPTGLIPPAGHELAAEMAEWVDVFERMLLMLRTSTLLRQRYGD
jgi:thiol-disulfide isomerase/thioredoxin